MSAVLSAPAAARRADAAPARNRQHSLTHPPRTGLLLVAPALAMITVFVLVPLLFALGISFTNWPLIGQVEPSGLTNYVSIGGDLGFAAAVGYTLLYTAIVTLPILVLGYALAVLVRSRRRGATLLRTVFFLPFVVGLTTLSFITLLEAQPSSGAINLVLAALGVTDGSTAWLVDGALATVLISAMVIWGVAGLTMLLLMAGMQAIPREVYESADLDGASWWQQEWRITIPLLRRTIAMSLVISVIGSLLAFTQFYILTSGGPGSATTTVVLHIYKRAFVQLQLGAATALSIALVVVVALVTALQLRLLRTEE
jgi:multiple sugar transport system permease protein